MRATMSTVMWRILQQKKPDDYVLATGEKHSVREFVERAFAEVGRQIEWSGKEAQEIGRDPASGEVLVAVDENIIDRRKSNSCSVIRPRRAKCSVGSIRRRSSNLYRKWFRPKSPP